MSPTPNPPGDGGDRPTDEPASDPTVPEPQGRIFGMPYDLRRPTVTRLRSRWWNPDDRRILTPKTFGAGWDVNLYWLTHPGKYLRNRHD